MLHKQEIALQGRRHLIPAFYMWFLLLCTTASPTFAQKVTEKPRLLFKDKKEKIGWVYHPEEKTFALTDRKGKRLTGFDFVAPSDFTAGVAVVKKRNLSYFLWKDGRLSAEGYDFILPSGKDFYVAGPGGKLFDRTGHLIEQTIEYVYKLPNGYILYATAEGKGLKDMLYKTVLAPSFEDLDTLGGAYLKYELAGKWGIMTMAGKRITENVYNSVERIAAAPPIFQVATNVGYGLVDSTGKVVLEPIYDLFWDIQFSEGRMHVSQKGKMGFIDTAYQLRIPCRYEQAGNFARGYALARSGDKIVRVDMQGQETPLGKDSRLELLNDSLVLMLGDMRNAFGKKLAGGYLSHRVITPHVFALRRQSGWSLFYDLINPQGLRLSERPYTSVELVADADKIIVQDSLLHFGLLDAQGREIWPPIFSKLAWRAEDSLFIAHYIDSLGVSSRYSRPLWGVLDRHGKALVRPAYNYDAFQHIEGVLWIHKDGKDRYFSEFKEIAHPDSVPVYRRSGVYRMAYNSTISYIDKLGKEIKTPYDYVYNATGTLSYQDYAPQTAFTEALKNRENFAGFLSIERQGKVGLFSASRMREIIPPVFDSIVRLAPDMFGVQKKHLWGIVNSTGTQVVPPKYDETLPFTQGMGVVRKGTKYGMVNKSGGEILEPTYDAITLTVDNLFWVLDRGGQYQYMDGQRYVYEETTNLEEIPAELEVIEKENPHGFPYIKEYIVSGEFSWQGPLIQRRRVFYDRGKAGFMNEKGIVLVKPKYDYAHDFADGTAIVSIGNKHGMIDTNGIEIIPALYDYVYNFKNGLILISSHQKYGIVNSKGQEVLPIAYDEIDFFKSYYAGAALVQKKGLYGLFRKDGSFLCPTIYTDIGAFYRSDNGWAKVTRNGLCGFIDTSGTEVVPARYYSSNVIDHKTVLVGTGNKYGLIDIATNHTSEMEFDKVVFVHNDIAVVIKGGKRGALNCRNLRYILPCQYDSLARGEGNCVLIIQQEKVGVANAAGTVFIPPLYDGIDTKQEAETGWFRVKRNGKWGWADAKGNLKIPCYFDAVAPFVKGIARVLMSPVRYWQLSYASGDYLIRLPESYPVEYYINTKGEFLILK